MRLFFYIFKFVKNCARQTNYGIEKYYSAYNLILDVKIKNENTAMRGLNYVGLYCRKSDKRGELYNGNVFHGPRRGFTLFHKQINRT